jgi:hypothetical protein
MVTSQRVNGGQVLTCPPFPFTMLFVPAGKLVYTETIKSIYIRD